MRVAARLAENAEDGGYLAGMRVGVLFMARGEVRGEQTDGFAVPAHLELEEGLRERREPVVLRAPDREPAQPSHMAAPVAFAEYELASQLGGERLRALRSRLEEGGDVWPGGCNHMR